MRHLGIVSSLLQYGANAQASGNSHGSVTNKSDFKDGSALHTACNSLDEEIVSIVLQTGADVNCCNAQGYSPLHIVAIKVCYR
jgi:ankyrin repeat protein